MGASSCERPASVGTAPRTPESSTVSEKSAVSTNSTESLQILPATAVPRENTEAIELGETEKEEIKGQVLVQLNDELSECLTFMRPTAAYRYNVDKRRTFQNNMLFGIGLLEFANAGDFAANVWNEIPAPIYAQVLMAVGGTFALCVSYFGFKDASLSWNNVVLLRDERRFLRTRKAAGAERKVMGRDEDVRLDVNFRENGTEMADRFGMDIIMGFAAVVVGVGTLLALGGRNENVYRASNLLSGYIGNGPAAFWGLTNVAWCLFVWRRMQRHHIATTREFPEGDPICAMMWRRTRIVMGHAAVYGTAGFIAGIASLITSTRWWGYVILAPCILAAVGSNHIFRHYILYDRVSIQEMPLVDKAAIIRQLRGILLIREIVNGAFSPAIAQLNSRPLSLPSVLQCILELGLYEDFCIRILKDPTLAVALFGQENEDIVIDSRRLARITDSVSVQCLLEIAQSCLADLPKMCSHDRETFLVETLGCLLCVSHPDAITRLGKRLGHDIEMV